MLEVIELFLLLGELLFHKLYLLLGLEVVVSDVELKKNILSIDGLSLKAVDIVVFSNLIVDIRSYLLKVFLTLISA